MTLPDQRLFDAMIYLEADGGTQVVIYKDDDLHSASRRFSPATLLPLKDWIKNPTWTPCGRVFDNPSIRFNFETGLLELRKDSSKVHSYDPNSDEQMAKLVRKLKSLAKIPNGTTPPLPGLTRPEVLDHPITRYTNPRAAKGSGHRPVRKSQAKEASPEETERMVLDALASLRKEML